MSDPSLSRPPQQAAPIQAQPSSERTPETSPANVKVYERPERKGLSPVLLLVALVIVVMLAVLIYRILVH